VKRNQYDLADTPSARISLSGPDKGAFACGAIPEFLIVISSRLVGESFAIFSGKQGPATSSGQSFYCFGQ
jgi:hypothetical protein